MATNRQKDSSLPDAFTTGVFRKTMNTVNVKAVTAIPKVANNMAPKEKKKKF